jgi:hypothetical protein
VKSSCAAAGSASFFISALALPVVLLLALLTLR